jgi:hypothetical protein
LISKALNGLLLLVAAYLLVSCANPVTPSGGPKDTDPPKFIKSEPPMYSRNFNEEKIKIAFNEFIQLKNINDQVIISPPMITAPVYKLKGKSVVIEIQESLKENTTYNIFFGNAIVDLTENNPLENFQYIFSTGNVIDSLSIEGQLFNAFDLKPLKSVNVMLYTNNNDTIVFDSLPYFVKPYYMTKTDQAGNFSLRNLADQPYKIFALNDLNGNLIYDQPTESIGFIEETINPTYKPPVISDTTEQDTGHTSKDFPLGLPPKNIKLSLFQEIDSVQKLLKTAVPKKNQINLIFKRPVNNLSVIPLNLDSPKQWAVVEHNATNDTITYWVKNIEKDSLKLEIRDDNIILDTLKIALFKKAKGKKSESENEKLQKLAIKNNLKNNYIDLNKPLILIFSYPLQTIDTSGIRLFENDTIQIAAKYAYIDTIGRKIKFEHKWKKSTAYSLLIRDSTFIDIHNQQNDSLLMKFTSKSPEDYGNLILNVTLINTDISHIIQLISGEMVIREAQLKSSEKLSFSYLAPGKYTLKMIDDSNNNGKWDTGDYIYNIQPETVRFFPAEITVRANWDIEEEWRLEP